MSEKKQTEIASYLPANWEDDKRMNALFLDFRHRSVNPTDYQAKLTFWKQVIIDWMKVADLMVVNIQDMEQAFVRKGRIPSCLQTVVRELARDGILLPMADFITLTSSPSWLSWSADILLRRPLSYAWKYINGTVTSIDAGNTNFINIDKLKTVAENVRNRHKTLVESGVEKNTIMFEILQTHCHDIVNLKHDLELCLLWLQKEGLISIHLEQQQKIIKFIFSAQKLEPHLDEKEKALIKLNMVKKDVENDIRKHQSNIDKYMQEVLNQIKLGSKVLAKSALKKKKQTEKRLLEKEGVLENVERLIYQLEEVNTQEAVLDALEKGAKALKHVDFSINKVDDIIAAVSKTVEDQQEIQDALSSTFDDNFDLSTLEDELNAILSENCEEDQIVDRNTTSVDGELSKDHACENLAEVPDLPSPPSFPVFKNINSLTDVQS